MAMSKAYLTVNGKIRSEHRLGEAKSRDYMHDALGNVVAVYQNNSIVADGYYSCLGRLESGSWNMAALGYRFSWNGAHGYRQTRLEWSSTYVRARHHAFMSGNWTTVDPLWPDEMPYGYVNGMAMSAIDPSGMKALSPCPPLKMCRQKPKNECYLCAYHAARRAQYQPRSACTLANKICGTHKKCGPCGHLNMPKLDVTCFNIYQVSWKNIHEECGATGDRCDIRRKNGSTLGHDKLSHCFAFCTTVFCHGVAATAAIRFTTGRDSDPYDDLANDAGLQCADEYFGFAGLLFPPCRIGQGLYLWHDQISHCLKCCEQKIQGLPIEHLSTLKKN